MNTTVLLVLILKLYAVFMLLGSSVLWFVRFQEYYKVMKEPKAWAYFGFIIVGILLAIYFIDGWRPA